MWIQKAKPSKVTGIIVNQRNFMNKTPLPWYCIHFTIKWKEIRLKNVIRCLRTFTVKSIWSKILCVTITSFVDESQKILKFLINIFRKNIVQKQLFIIIMWWYQIAWGNFGKVRQSLELWYVKGTLLKKN